MTKIPLRKESIIYLLFVGLIIIILYIFLPILAIISFILFLFVLYFFRNSEKLIHFRLVKFGSCTKNIVPFDTVVQVNKGDIVIGGLTVIGVIK